MAKEKSKEVIKEDLKKFRESTVELVDFLIEKYSDVSEEDIALGAVGPAGLVIVGVGGVTKPGSSKKRGHKEQGLFVRGTGSQVIGYSTALVGAIVTAMRADDMLAEAIELARIVYVSDN